MTSTSGTSQRNTRPGAARARTPTTTATWIVQTAALVLAVVSLAAVSLAAPSHADTDTDFANQLHTYGIYGPRDENAWLAKLTCKRLSTRVDGTAFASATFVKTNLARTASTQQAWQFLGAAIDTYCPEQTPALQSAADSSATTTKEHG